jgi:hypothetical protein
MLFGPSHHERRREHRGQLLHGRTATEGHRETLVVVPVLPGDEGITGGVEVLTGVAAPELFRVDPMAAFDLAVLLRPSRSNVAEPNAEFLAAEREEQRELKCRCRPESCESETETPR